MAYPKTVACLAVGANTRTIYIRGKVEKPHPATGLPVVVKPPLSIVFPGGPHVLFLDAEKLKRFYEFESMKAFVAWLKGRGEVEKGEIIFSALLEEKGQAVANMGRRDVEEELRRRLMLREDEDLNGEEDDHRAALLELRRIAGEGVPEPRPHEAVRPAEPEVDDESGKMAEGILTKFAAR